MGQTDDGDRTRGVANRTRLPGTLGDEGLNGPCVSFSFNFVGLSGYIGAQRMVVHEYGARAGILVTADMGELEKQTEPEIVETAVSQRQTYDRAGVGGTERRAVEISLLQMGNYDQCDAMVGQKLLGSAGAKLRGAQLRRFTQEFRCNSTGLIGRGRRTGVGRGWNLPAPGLDRIGIRFGVQASMIIAAKGNRGRCRRPPPLAVSDREQAPRPDPDDQARLESIPDAPWK